MTAGGWTPDEVALARFDTPGADAVLHLNACGSALPPNAVVETMIEHLRLEQRVGGYEAQAMAADRLAAVTASLATLLRASDDEIAIMPSASMAWEAVVTPLTRHLTSNDEIVTSVAEYAANSLTLLRLHERTGAGIVVVPDDVHGQVDVEVMETLLTERVKLIVLTHVPSNGGLVNPAEEVGRLARAYGIPYVLDCAQSIGQMPLSVDDLGCDALVGTGRKFLRAPRGTAVLWVRRELLRKLRPDRIEFGGATWDSRDRFTLRRDAKRFETWERPVAAVLGLGVAVDHALEIGLDRIEARVTMLAEQFRTSLWGRPSIVVQDKGARRCGIVSFTASGVPSDDMVSRLATQNIQLSVSSAQSTLLDMEARGLASVVRAGIHYYNTSEDIDRAAEAIRAVARG